MFDLEGGRRRRRNNRKGKKSRKGKGGQGLLRKGLLPFLLMGLSGLNGKSLKSATKRRRGTRKGQVRKTARRAYKK